MKKIAVIAAVVCALAIVPMYVMSVLSPSTPPTPVTNEIVAPTKAAEPVSDTCAEVAAFRASPGYAENMAARPADSQYRIHFVENYCDKKS